MTPARPSPRRSSMWWSMSASTSLSSSTFGLANTAKPTLRKASTQGRTTSALPGAMLVKTVASGSRVAVSVAESSAVRESSHRPRASNRGGRRPWGVRPGSRPGPCRGSGRPDEEHALVLLDVTPSAVGGAACQIGTGCAFAETHGLIFPQMSSLIVLPTCAPCPRTSSPDARGSSATPSRAREHGSASPASRIASAYSA